MSGESTISLDQAVDLTRTGDLWLFRGDSAADRAIRALTNAPVNHVGMAVVLDDPPPLMWHAELGRGLLDVWTGNHHRGVQLHDLREAVVQWSGRYEQRPWMRQLSADITPEREAAVLTTIARRARRAAGVEVTYCAEVVAATYTAMGLLPADLPTNYYDPGRFWSGDDLELLDGATLSAEIRVQARSAHTPGL